MTCDECEKQLAEAPGQTRFGSAPFTGWYSLKKLGGGTTIDQIREQKEWDFCCIDCLLAFTDRRKTRRGPVRTAPDLAKELYKAIKVQCPDKMMAALHGIPELHCLNAENKSTDVYPYCAPEYCPHVISKLSIKKDE